MGLFKRKQQHASTPEVFTLFLLKKTPDIIKETCETLEKHLGDDADRPKLPKVKTESFLFFLFALDYWIQTSSTRTQEEKAYLRQAFGNHLANMTGGGKEGEAKLDTYYKRFTAYGQIIGKAKDDKSKFTDLAMKLSEFCGMSHALFFWLAPELFTKAGESVVRLKSVQLKLR